MQAEYELIEEARHLAEYEKALQLLLSVAGPAAAEKADRASCTMARGMWALVSRHGQLIAEVNVHEQTVLVHALPALGTMRTARILTTRVQCQCGHPKVLQGVPIERRA